MKNNEIVGFEAVGGLIGLGMLSQASAVQMNAEQNRLIALAMMTPEQRAKYDEMVAEQKRQQVERSRKALRTLKTTGYVVSGFFILLAAAALIGNISGGI